LRIYNIFPTPEASFAYNILPVYAYEKFCWLTNSTSKFCCKELQITTQGFIISENKAGSRPARERTSNI
jgi:hypothetical protein